MITTDERCPLTIAHVHNDIPTGEANANLIASAPELLAALEKLADASCALEEAKSTATDDAITCLEGRLEKAIDQAGAAIAKAKGAQ